MGVSDVWRLTLVRGSTTAAARPASKKRLGWLTGDMVDSVVPKMWTRDHADYPEIGFIADEMDAISRSSSQVKGTNEDGDQVLTGIDRNAYLSLLVLAVKDLRARVDELESTS